MLDDDTDQALADATRHVTASASAAGMRIDKWLAEQCPDLSRARIQALIAAGQVRDRAGRTIAGAKHKVVAGAAFTLIIPPTTPATPQPEAIPLAILYEDEALIVIDKPAGLVVHPGAGNPAGTLVNALLHHCAGGLSGIGGVARPGIVHRLDKDTSGVMVAAKQDAAHQGLARQFADHRVERAYRALVRGAPEPEAGRIDAPIARHPVERKKMAVVAQGRPAATRYRTLDRFGAGRKPCASLVECRLETGRTHQVRVHMAHRHHPLIGDPVYGRHDYPPGAVPDAARRALLGFPRQALHARLLGFSHPLTGATMRFESADPADLATLINMLAPYSSRR